MGDARPYLAPSLDAIRAGAWIISTGDGERALPEWLSDWDVSQTISVKRRVELDRERIWTESGLEKNSRLALSVVLSSEFEEEACRVDVPEGDGEVPLELGFDLEGPSLGWSVSLLTYLVLERGSAASKHPVAQRRGSILWQDVRKVRLYGDSSQFPMMEVDFADFNLNPASPWFVELGSDLELPAMGSVLLMLNERFPLVSEAVREMGTGRPELAAVRSFLFTDVARVMVEAALAQEDIAQEWQEESLGAVLAALIESRFSETPAELRGLRDTDPAKWAATIEAAFGLLKDPLA